jgi:uncharacterized coiled-coil protein SlyX
MESVMAYRKKIEELRCQVRAMEKTIEVINKAFAQEAEHLRRQDQARCLDDLRARVAQEVTEMQRLESAASYSFTKGTLISGLMKFAGGSAMAAALHSKEHPLSVGAKLAGDEFSRTKAFGTVAVAVGPKGIPDDVRTVSLSRVARETGRTESEVRAALEGRGYRIMMPSDFLRSLGELREKVLGGSATLPFIEARFSLKPLVPKLIQHQPKADCR